VVTSPRIALDAAQARLMVKIIRDTTTLEDLIFQDNKVRNAEGGRQWDDLGQEYLTIVDGYTLVMIAIQSKAGRFMYEGTEKISYVGRVDRIKVPEISLLGKADSKAKAWQEPIKQGKELCNAVEV